ncbi:MAG: hypothetical protein GF307_13440 [candidate division Zixibacteria bacterium]|nr:hypothetical protein [candidate division Zixibacteria bacterium]
MKRKSKFAALLISSVILSIIACNTALAQPEAVIEKYVEAVTNGKWRYADDLWLQREIEHSRRMGITYENIEAKYDCSSPLVSSAQFIQQTDIQPTEYISDNKAKIVVKVRSFKDTVDVPYYLINENEKWQLCSPMAVYADGWESETSKYTRIFYSENSRINSYAISAVDAFIDSMGAVFNIPPDRMKHLEKVKLDYYHCDEQQIENITGFKAQGLTNFQYDAVITQHIPHTHELTHFMINYALESLPLYTLPAIQEGLACCLGGRWGKTPEVIFYWGAASQSLEFGELDEVLSFNGFYHGQATSDVSYALSSLLIKAMLGRFDMEQFKEYYLRMSGANYEVVTLPGQIAKVKAKNIFGVEWDTIRADYDKLVEKYLTTGIYPTGAIDGKRVRKLKDDDMRAEIYENDSVYCFKIKLPDDKAKGTILFKDKKHKVEKDYDSKFYYDHLPDGQYDGERYGIWFSAGEAGLYNYYTNFLVAKFVLGFTPSEDYWNSDKNEIRFAVDKRLIPGKIKSYKIKLRQ